MHRVLHDLTFRTPHVEEAKRPLPRDHEALVLVDLILDRLRQLVTVVRVSRRFQQVILVVGRPAGDPRRFPRPHAVVVERGRPATRMTGCRRRPWAARQLATQSLRHHVARALRAAPSQPPRRQAEPSKTQNSVVLTVLIPSGYTIRHVGERETKKKKR